MRRCVEVLNKILSNPIFILIRSVTLLVAGFNFIINSGKVTPYMLKLTGLSWVIFALTLLITLLDKKK